MTTPAPLPKPRMMRSPAIDRIRSQKAAERRAADPKHNPWPQPTRPIPYPQNREPK